MHLIAYVSDFLPGPDPVEKVLADIVRSAKKRNPQYKVTGVLFFVNGQFLQVIEGLEDDLKSLMARIEEDDRHDNIEYLIDTPIERRAFQQWNMDSFDLDGESRFDADTLKDLTHSFQKNLLPRSDMLVKYYKTLLNQPVL